jgi:hypothetical protein
LVKGKAGKYARPARRSQRDFSTSGGRPTVSF